MQNIRTGPVGYNNPSQNDVHVFMDKERTYHAITLGAGSYCDDVVLEFGGGRMCHILIGRYTSIGQAIFVMGYNHDHRRVSSYPFEDFLIDGGAANHYTEANHYQIIIGNDVWIGRGATLLGESASAMVP